MWDYRNRLTEVIDKSASGTVLQDVSYTYDALNQRIAKTVGTQTTRFVYDRGNVYLEFSGNSSAPSTRYLYGPMVDQVLAQESNNTTTWMLADHLGSVRDLVNNSGTVVNHFTYDSFGQVVGSTGTVDTRYKYTGREYDSETGLYYYRARYFDAGVGRFIGQDSIGFGAGDSNLYRYVGNNPLSNVDPSGNVKIEVVFNHLGSVDEVLPSFQYPGYYAPTGRKVSVDHAFILVTDKKCLSAYPNAAFGYRGGPTYDFGTPESTSIGFGAITAISGPYSAGGGGHRKFKDFQSGDQRRMTVYENSSKNWTEFNSKFQQTINFIEGSNIAYNMFGPNSNSVATQFLKEGLPPNVRIPRPLDGINVPGWGQDLRNPKLPRWVPPQYIPSRVPQRPNVSEGWGVFMRP